MSLKNLFLLLVSFSFIFGCTSKDSEKAKKELWIYTSLYKDTIADLTPRLEKAFPDAKFNWFQAGSEEIATKVNAEILAGGTKADILISSDRFWYEEMGDKELLIKYKSPASVSVREDLKHPDGYYTTLSIPIMVLTYNSEALKENEIPKTFKELADPKWKDKFSTGSPLASGTNFTTVAMLQHHYGWDYIQALRKNNTISQGGNSAVLRRIQSKERPIGWVLLENVLRFQSKDQRLKVIYPTDGAVFQSNVIAITNKKTDRKLAKKFVDWMFGKEGQDAMARSFMYPTVNGFDPPKGAPPLKEIKSFPWTREFIKKIVSSRAEIKEKFASIMFE